MYVSLTFFTYGCPSAFPGKVQSGRIWTDTVPIRIAKGGREEAVANLHVLTVKPFV